MCAQFGQNSFIKHALYGQQREREGEKPREWALNLEPQHPSFHLLLATAHAHAAIKWKSIFTLTTSHVTKQNNETKQGEKNLVKASRQSVKPQTERKKKRKNKIKKNRSIIMRDWNGVALSKVTIGDKSTRMRCRPIAVAAQKLG